MSDNDQTAADLGVVDYLVIEAPVSGAAVEDFGALLDLVERDTIRVLDLEIVAKDAGGAVALVDAGQVDGLELGGFAAFAGSSSGLLDDDDVRAAGELVEPGNLAVVVVYENVWTAKLASALSRHGARLVATGQVPAGELEAALDLASV